MTARSDDVKVRDAEITRQHGIIQRLDAEVEELRAENERLRRVHEADAAGLNRWCNYQDRLFAVMTSDEIRAFEKRLDEGGWVNEPLCVHVDSRERAIRWAVTLEGQLAEIDRLCKTWEADEQEHLNTFGQHLPCSLAVPAEQLRAALTGSTE